MKTKNPKKFKRYIVCTTRIVEVTSVITATSEEEAIQQAKVDPRPVDMDTKHIVVDKVVECQ